MTTKSGKHANKTSGSAKDKAAKVVDMRKVAALSAGAAGVIAGAAIAFGATPAMAAEDGTAAPVNTNDPAKEQNLVDANKGNSKTSDDSKATKKNEASKDETTNSEVKKEAKKEESKEEPKKEQTKPAEQSVAKTDGNTDVTKTETGSKVESTASVDNQDAKQDSEETGTPAGSVVNKRTRRSLDEKKQPEPTKDAQAENQDRAANGGTKEVAFSSQKGEMPNVYGFGTVDNQYDDQLANNPITFKLPKQKDATGADKDVTRVAVFPSPTNHINTPRTTGSIDFDSANDGHQPYSGEYVFKKNNDGSATLTMNRIFRKDERGASKGIKNAQGYSATRSIQINPTPIPGSAKEDAVSDQFRAALLVPPKSAGTIVKKVSDATITENDVNNAMDDAKKNGKTTHVGKSGIDGLSLEAQIQALSKFGGRAQDTIDEKIPTSSNEYDKNALTKANNKVGVSIVDTHFVTDLGFKSQAIPLTIVRYNDVIDKPVVEDPTNLSAEVKEDIAKKLAKINGVTPDKITFDGDKAVIHFDGVDEKDAPKIDLKDLVLKKFTEDQINVPAESTATVIYNPLAYSDAEIKSIKKAIYEANKDKTELGLSATDYENQISLSYLTGNLTKTGHANQGISNGQAENTITVKIKTDKAVAEFTSDVKAHKLTRLADIRKDYTVSWTKDKIEGRTTDEGLSWSEDKKTIIYRYDPTAAKEFDTNKILDLLKATAKDKNSGLRDLTGNEKLDHEGVDGKDKKSHVGYVIKDDQPTTELSLGNMSGANWQYSQKVDNSGVDLGDNLSEAGSYSWDNDAKPVFVAAKKGKVYKARLFVLPYGLTMYRNVYMENGNQPWNTPKAINVIFVPQTNHKTSDLKKSVDDHKTENVDGKDVPTQSAYYNASDKVKEAYDKALQTAKTLYDSVKDTDESNLTEEQKAQIDNATINLNKARAELDGANTDKNGLTQSIDANGKAKEGQTAEVAGTVTTDRYKNVTDQAFQTDDGKPDTKKNEAAKKAKEDYDKALEEAKKLKDDANATQKAVDEAKAKLDAARKELDKYSTNKDKLNAAVAEHGQVNTGDAKKTDPAEKLKTADPTYQNSSETERKAYDDAVAEADRVSKEPNASQKEVNKAIEALKKAKADLDKNATDKSPLDAAVQKSLDKDPTKHSVFYTNAKNKTGDTAAQQAVQNYDDALAKAKQVLADDKATKKDVEDAKKALEDAEKVLYAETYQTKATDLTEALADNFSGYLMPAYFNAFDLAQSKKPADATKAQQAAKDFKAYNDAYHAAKELKKKFDEAAKNPTTATPPTQKEIDDAKKALEEARKVIDKYATDTSRLSAAALNDVAIQNSPAYTNLKELAEKQNPSEEEKAKVEAAKKAKEAYDKAVEKLHKALSNTLDKDKDAQGNPLAKIPDANEDPTSKNYLDGVQAHANGEPLNKDVDAIVKEMNEAAKALDKFATKTDKLLESINKDTDTQHDPAYKNSQNPHKLGADGQEDKTGYEAIMQKAKDYDDALADAKKLLTDPTATQAQVDAALKKLNEKRDALKAQDTNVEALKSSVEKHGKEKQDETAATEGTVTSDAYRNASDPHFMKEEDGKLVPDKEKNTQAAAAKKAYDEALTKAQELLKKHDDKTTPLDAKPTQKQIDEALTKLDKARTEIEKYKTVTTDLEKEINESTAEGAPGVTENDFENTPEFKNANDKNDNEDVKAYKKALNKARDLVKAANPTDPGAKNSSHPTQQQINDALDALKAAKKQITDNYKTNLEPLTSAKDFAGGDFKKTPEYKNAAALKDNQKADQNTKDAAKKVVEALDDAVADSALKKAKDIIDNPTGKTQKEVDAALKTLQEAMDAVTNGYKTKTDKLENEVGDKDAQGKPVAPKFEESVAYKNALAKKNAESEEDAKKDGSATKKLEDYNKKLKAAQDLIAQVNSTDPNADPDKKPTQAQVDAALEALKKAKQAINDAFTTKVDALKKETKELNDEGQPKDNKDKFENSAEFKNALAKKDKEGKNNADIQAYNDALAKANDFLALFNEDGTPKADIPAGKQIPTQQEVDAALDALKAAKKKITDSYKTDPSKLKSEADADGTFTKTPEYQNAQAKGDEAAKKALEDYKKALEDANKVLGDKNATQAQVDEALKKLQDAKSKLSDGYKTNKTDLTAEAGKDSDFTKSPEYQNAQAKGDDASKQALEDYKKALEDANKVLGDKNATQADVDAALKKLQDAKSKLSDGYKTNKTDLTAEAGKDSDFTKSPEYQNAAGSPEADAYKQALDEANKVLGDKNATQAQVDDALRKLQDAKKKLADSHKTDKSDLNTEAGKDPDFRKSIPFIIGKAADLAEYQQALNDANSVLKDPNATQAQVDQALRRLRAAKQKLIDSYNRLINSGSGVGSGSDHDFGTDTDVNTGVGVNDSNTTNVNNVVDKGALQAEVDAALGDVSANANGVVADSNLVSEFNAALNYARSVLADANATQGQVDSALARLRAARAALRAGMLAARNSAGMNLKRGDVSGVNTGASSSVFAAFAAVFAGLGVAGAASKRRKHSAR